MKIIYIVVAVLGLLPIFIHSQITTYSKLVEEDTLANYNGNDIFEIDGFFYIVSGVIQRFDSLPSEVRTGFSKISVDGDTVFNKILTKIRPSGPGVDGSSEYYDGKFYIGGDVQGEADYELNGILTEINEWGDTLRHFISDTLGIESIRDLAIYDNHIYTSGFARQTYSGIQPVWRVIRKLDMDFNVIWELFDTSIYDGEIPLNDGWTINIVNDKILIGGRTDAYETKAGYILELTLDGEFIRDTIFLNPVGNPPGDWNSSINIRPHPSGGYVFMMGCEQANTASDNYYNYYMVKLSEEFDIEWTYIFGAGAVEDKIINNFRVLADGSIIGCGVNYAHPSDIDQNKMAWIFKLSAEGEIIWERNFHGNPNPLVYPGVTLSDIIATSDGGYATSGHYWQYTGLPGGRADLWLLKLDENGCLTPGCTDALVIVGIEDSFPDDGMLDVVEKFFTLSPNPTTDYATASFYNPISRKASTLVLSSLCGQEIVRIDMASGQRVINLPLADLMSGIYLVSYMSEGRILQSERLVVE